jgi:two-component system, OmpR family, phosphate regulon sensor histidine kinase PhoR
MIKRSSLAWQIILLVVALALTVALLVIWIINNAAEHRWTLLAIGTVLFSLILVCVIFYFFWGIKEHRLNRRQANFIDSVTHELKSPLASIKLCLQTLELRAVTPEQQREFLKFIMEDVERLGGLIDHLLAVARLDQAEPKQPPEEIPLEGLLAKCTDEIRRRYDLANEQIRLDVVPCQVTGQLRDLEIVFLNLLDNAVKYGGRPPEVLVQAIPKGENRVIVRVSDNGQGVRFDLRAKIFQRFFRGGSELERVTKGTGLGLYLVKTLVKRMKGTVQVHHRGPLSGATFEVEFPGRRLVVNDQVAGVNPGSAVSGTAATKGEVSEIGSRVP